MIRLSRRSHNPTVFRLRAAVTVLVACQAILISVVLPGPGTLVAQDDPRENLTQSLEKVRAAFHQQLEKLARTSLEQDMPGEAAIARNAIIVRDPERQYIFLPPAHATPVPENASRLQKLFHRRLKEIKREHAEKLFQEVGAATEKSLGPEAYQLLHEVLVYDPDHDAAREILGFKKTGKRGWVRSDRRVNASKARTTQKTIGWKKGTYWVIQSPHFRIYSAAGETAGRELATILEQTYWVWRQVWFDYWATDRELAQWLEGKGSDRSDSKRYDVILFRDRQQYLSDLADVANVAMSSGYYNEDRGASLFYFGEDVSVGDWRHETVHQLLQENSGRKQTVAGKGHAWLVEGIAMYFESMQVHDNYVTLGGFDAPRLQYARLRKNREGFYIPMTELHAIGRSELQRHPDVAKIYSQACGISQFLFTAQDGIYRDGCIEFVKDFYQRNKVTSSLDDLTLAFDQLDRQYAEFLGVDSGQLDTLFDCDSITGLALGRARLKNGDVQKLTECNRLRWLELSENPITDAAIDYLQGMSELTQLFLDVTAITDAAAPKIAKLKTLQELDLASTRFGDAGIEQLDALTELQVLWLAGSKVSNGCIDTLAAMPNLQLLDLRQTGVTKDAVQRLQQLRPNLKIIYQE